MSETIISKWETFFEDRGYLTKIQEIANAFPERKTLEVKFGDLDEHDTDFVLALFETPALYIESGQRAIKNLLPPDVKNVHIHLRVTEVPRDYRVEVRDIRSDHLGHFISVEGVVRRATEVRPRIITAAFKCPRCQRNTLVPQDEIHVLREPLACKPDGEDGCETPPNRFTFIPEESEYIDTQKIELQEAPERLRGGAQPQTLISYVEDDLTGEVYPGDRIILNGTLKAKLKGIRGSTTKSTELDIFQMVNSIDRIQGEYEEIDITEEDMEKINELAATGDGIYRSVIQSISPSIYGLEIEKEALALQLFGGVAKNMPDGTSIRGDIHILLIGDPGTAKSQLLRYIKDLTPRGVYASGKSSSSAGLTAAAVKDDFGDGRWTLEAGALVLADKGLAAIDELDKMSAQDRSSMHEAMEQQTISVAKAGIRATLQSRCSVLGAANPKSGRFDEMDYIYNQIKLPPTLLSRFDMVFPLTDRPDKLKDGVIAEHILRGHRVGELTLKAEDDPEAAEEKERSQDLIEQFLPTIDKELLRKYVYMAKKKIPVMTDEAMEAIKSYYLEVRRMGQEVEGSPVPITARQLEALVRLSEASSKWRMGDKVTADDANRAIRIAKEYFTKVLGRGEETGWDADIMLAGIAKSQRDKIAELRRVMKDLLMDPDIKGVTVDDVGELMESKDFTRSQIEANLDRLRQEGEIYSIGFKEGKHLYRFVR